MTETLYESQLQISHILAQLGGREKTILRIPRMTSFKSPLQTGKILMGSFR